MVETSKEAVIHFHKGRYHDSLKILQSQAPPASPISGWIHSNNMAVCQIMVKSGNETKLLEQIIFETQGLPLCAKLFPCEASVVGNLLALESSSFVDKKQLYARSLNLFSTFCRRVAEWLGLRFSESESETESLNIHLIVHDFGGAILSMDLPQALNMYCSLLVTFASALLLCREEQQCAQLLSQMITTFTNKVSWTPHTSVVHLLFAGNNLCDGSAKSYNLGSICRLLLALCYTSQGNFSQCITVLAEIQEHQLKHRASSLALIKGHVYNQQDETRDRCLSCLCDALKRKDFSNKDKSALHILLGHCLAAQSKSHCAIQQYKQALLVNDSDISVLYYISRQYNKLNRTEAELETLALLESTLTTEMRKDAPNHKFSLSIEQLTHDLIIQQACISQQQALYALASRSMEMQRYELAASKFEQLLNLPLESTHTGPLVIPAVQRIYEDMAFCLLQLKDYEKCIETCNIILRKQCPKQNTQEEESQSGTSGRSSKKRSYEMVHELDTMDGISIRAYKYKADALSNKKQIKEAVKTIDRIIPALENAVKQSSSAIPPAKKAKHSEDASSIEMTAPQSSSLLKHLVQLYSMKSTLLSKIGDKPGYVHFSRLASQLKPVQNASVLQ